MFKVIESENSGDKYNEYLADSRDVHSCSHHFRRVGDRIECDKCGVGYFDSPTDPFPVDELNKFFDDRRNQEYFKRNIP
jgi:hypothetical protein